MESTIVGEDGEPAADIQKKFWNHIKATKKDVLVQLPSKIMVS